MNQHELKIWPKSFDAIKYGLESFKIRLNDRGFNAGDVLILQEYEAGKQEYTGREITAHVTYLLQGGEAEVFGLCNGFAVMSIAILNITE